ncbi:MAG: phosphatidylserine decarboxylase family protein [Bacteroidia bacterium]|nr:phosphatidylserine decarboxylase family protein [Bacteroidia bacterium]
MAYRLHREGVPTLSWTLVFGLIIALMSSFFYSKFPYVTYAAIFLVLIVLGLVLQFFRNPVRKTVLNENAIISPADGKVVVVEKTEEPEFLKTGCIKISVFMSPFDVHVNRYPVSGSITYFQYHPGKFLAAWEPKSSSDNERTTICIKAAKGDVLFRQIAGALARRIVWYCNVGDLAIQGNEMGFIKFGSRVDVFLPLSCRVCVKPGDRITGGITTLAFFE